MSLGKKDIVCNISTKAFISNKESHKVLNHFIKTNEGFESRPGDLENINSLGGQFDASRYFSGEKISPFFGASISINDNTLIKIEKDTTLTTGLIEYERSSSDYSIGLDYSFNENLVLGISFERGNFASLRFSYKNNPKKTYRKYTYRKAEENQNDSKYLKLIRNLENNGIGVNKVVETANSIGLELTQFTHPNLQIVEEIISQASRDAEINKDVKKNLKIVNLEAVKEFDNNFEEDSQLIYQRNKSRRFNNSYGIKLRPFIASREEFFKGAILLENDTEYIIRDDLLFHLNLKYSLADNFDDLRFPPTDLYLAQVRSDVKEYLKNMDEGILVGRAQIDYYTTPYNNHYFMFSGGIFEDMFSGYGVEYLYYKNNKNYSFGIEIFDVRKRDYDWGFGTLDYKNITGHINFNYRNYGIIPFDMKISYGEYLAGDVGSTIELSRSYSNGVKFGVFASNTNVTAEQFGEGAFDKGLFFNIPIYGSLINYTWRPLTKDPGAKLVRKNNLNDLLVKFKPIN